MFDRIKKFFEEEKCIYCGKPMSIVHEVFCPYETLGYDPKIKIYPTIEQQIIMVKNKR